LKNKVGVLRKYVEDMDKELEDILRNHKKRLLGVEEMFEECIKAIEGT
jgi:hypothetical protein